MGEAGTLGPDSLIVCEALHCTLRASVCVKRWLMSERSRTCDTWRGIGSVHPSCGRKCLQGCAIRAALDPEGRGTWRGKGPGGRFENGQRDVWKQMAARRRLLVVGLLDAPPRILDVDPDPILEPDPPPAPAA